MADRLYACDFDGTVNRFDVGSKLVRLLMPDAVERVRREYRSGRLTNRTFYRDELAPALSRTSIDIISAVTPFLRPAPGFREFALSLKKPGERLAVVSDGFDLYINEFFRTQGIHAEVYANGLARDAVGRYEVRLGSDGRCQDCGICKTDVLGRLKRSFREIVYVGDGDSDFCAPDESSVFFGKRFIFDKIRRSGRKVTIPQFLFYDFFRLRRLMEKRGRYRAVFLDLDGTLVDGFGIIFESFNHALVSLGHRRRPSHELRKAIGPALQEGFRMFVPAHEVEEATRRYREYYRDRYLPRTILFDGVRELLSMLKDHGITVGLVTNKKTPFARAYLGYAGIERFFDIIRGADEGLPPKPSPDVMHHLLATRGMKPDEVLYVGDSGIDGEFASRAGVDFIAVKLGLDPASRLHAWLPLTRCDSIADLHGTLAFLVRSP